ncbi:hypothetical protein ACS0TY_018450 [Phlomoides rotata]
MANSVSFFLYSSSIQFHPVFANSRIYASNSRNYPLASKIIVTNLPFSVCESRLHKEFAKYGQICEVNLVKDEARKKSKGFAFIQYASQEEALLAIESMDYQFFDERQVFVEIAKPRNNDFGRYPTTLGPPTRATNGDY